MFLFVCFFVVFFFNDTATTEIYTLSLHDALPIYDDDGDDDDDDGDDDGGDDDDGDDDGGDDNDGDDIDDDNNYVMMMRYLGTESFSEFTYLLSSCLLIL